MAESANSGRLRLSNGRLLLFACFSVWQMGVVFFSSSLLSLRGGSRAEEGIFAALLVLGYLASAAATGSCRRYMVLVDRWLLAASLLATALSFLPLDQPASRCLFYFQAFCCVFLIGGLAAVIIPLFEPESELRDMLLTGAVLGLAVLLLQNSFFPLPFWALNLASLLCQGLLLRGLFLLPRQLPALPPQPPPEPGRQGWLSAGFFFLVFLTGLLVCFSSTVAESLEYGTVLLYGSSLPGVGLFWLLWRRGWLPERLFRLQAAVICAGFALALASGSFPGLLGLACVLLGLGLPLFSCGGYLGIQLYRRYPSPWLIPGYILSALLAASLHSLLLEAFRAQAPLLLSIYGVVAILLLIACFFLEPHNRWQPLAAPVGPETENAAASDSRQEGSENGAAVSDGGQEDSENECAVSDGGQEGSENGAAAAGLRGRGETEGDESFEGLPPNANGGERENGQKDGEQRSKAAFSLDALAPRERELAELVLRGYTQSDIARIMTISTASVSSYRKRVYQKLGIHSRQELFRLAGINRPSE